MQWQWQASNTIVARSSYATNITQLQMNEWMNHIIYTPEIKYKTVTRFMMCNTKLVW